MGRSIWNVVYDVVHIHLISKVWDFGLTHCGLLCDRNTVASLVVGTWMCLLGCQVAEGDADPEHKCSWYRADPGVRRLFCGLVACGRIRLWSAGSAFLDFRCVLVQLGCDWCLAVASHSHCSSPVLHHWCQVWPSWKTSGYVVSVSYNLCWPRLIQHLIQLFSYTTLQLL